MATRPLLLVAACLALQACVSAGLAVKKENVTSRHIGIAPADLVTIGERKYYISPLGQRVVEAQVYCNADGMKLVSFEDQAKMTQIYDYLTEHGYSQTIWTSGERWQGVWRWSALGQVFQFTNWAPSQPDNEPGGDVCVYFQSETGWSDEDCDFHIHFMCEF